MTAVLEQGQTTESAALSNLPGIAEQGLSDAQVRACVERGEVNRVKTSTSRSFAQILRSNVFTLFNGIIFAAMIMVLVAGSWKDAVFGMVIVVNTAIGVITELRAKRTLDKLSILVAASSVVRRGGRDVTVAHDEIVLGDLLWIQSGDQIPADGQIMHVWGLELDESMLTGESRTVHKSEGDAVHSGSTVVAGLAVVRVTAVGRHSYVSTLTAQAKVYRKHVSDLTQGINTILKFMTVVIIPLCLLLVWSQIRSIGGWQVASSQGLWQSAVVSSVAGVVGMIPEGLVLLTSLNFAIAAMRLARQDTLVQELESVETLARVDSLNLDKTGTITDGSIVYQDLIVLDDHGTSQQAGVSDDQADRIRQALFDLANEPHPNATGGSILKTLDKQGINAGRVQHRIPFSSARKWSGVVRDDGMWCLGAPEILMTGISGDHGQLDERIESYAAQGSRVLMVARTDQLSGTVGTDGDGDDVLPSGLHPAALVLCAEHIRQDAASTLAWFAEQGVRCRVISGDNPATVGAIAAKVRLNGVDTPAVMDARELPDDTDELGRALEDVDVLGRVMPEQKQQIVQALQSRHHVVAMTGDGVNDALAIKEADLGIAMGNAAPATKAVAQIVLVTSRFSRLPDVVARGRQVMANIERVASLFLVKTTYSALISLGVVLSAMPFPYLPRHITYVGALTIGIPAFVLSLAPNTRRYLPGFLRRVVRFAVPGGVIIAASVLVAAWALPGIMGWSLDTASGLDSLRATCAIIIFAMGIVILARVARPLHSWRGLLVIVMAVAGVVGVVIPFVASFFALEIPSRQVVLATLLAVLAELVVLAIDRIVAYLWRRRSVRLQHGGRK